MPQAASSILRSPQIYGPSHDDRKEALTKLIRHHPFALLALVTILIGAAWHSSIVPPGMRPVLGPVVEIIGAWFIAAMRLVNRHAGGTGFTPLLGFLLGVAPYLLADLALNVWRKKRMSRRASAHEHPADARN